MGSAGCSAGLTGWYCGGNLSLNHESGMKGYLWANQIAWKDYAQPVEQVSQRVKRASVGVMEASQRPVRYLSSGKPSKEEHDNCVSWIEDFGRAQTLMDLQLTLDWATALNACALRAHPLFPELFVHYPVSYYWTSFQSEWAMDIVFRDPQQLRRLYPQLVHLGMVSFSSPDVMRFMDKKVSRKGEAVSRNAHEVVSDRKVRSEGVRIKHRLGKNSIKLYDKAYAEAGAVLRPELTLHAPGQFRVFRHTAGRDGRRAHAMATDAGRHRRLTSSRRGLAKGAGPVLHRAGPR
jgi:hypothetical protein